MSLERLLMRGYFAFIEPVQFRLKKADRLRRAGIADIGELPVATLQLGTPRALLDRQMVENQRHFISKFMRNDGRPPSRWRGSASVIDLDRFADPDAYIRTIKKATRRGITRELKVAREHGYACRTFDRFAHGEDLYDIETSKLFRTGGPVLKAIARRLGFADAGVGHDPWLGSTSLLYWTQDWGVFVTDAATGRERLVGSVVLRRIGNAVRMVSIMAHADHLPRGALKLLFVDIVCGLLARNSPATEGVRFVMGGAMEHGSLGLIDWKLRLQFFPHLIAEQ
ncbi:hypothetical protein ACO2RV_07740 [Ancylobacter sp. VNQ12]|uniref:hypothetical protein n=1 Tax=Ancylobacter sp. VNQ12 TaxID=3400920 RepID=UPI003C0DA55A